MDAPWEQLTAKQQKVILHGVKGKMTVRYKNRYGRSPLDAGQVARLSELLGVFFQFELDGCPATALFSRPHGIGAFAGTGPNHSLSFGLVGAGGHRHRVRNHEHGVEAHAKLADNLAGIKISLSGRLQKFPRARLGDGAQVLDDLPSIRLEHFERLVHREPIGEPNAVHQEDHH